MIRSAPVRMSATIVHLVAWTIGIAWLLKGHDGAGDGFSGGLMAGLGVAIHTMVFGGPETDRMPVVRHGSRIAAAGLLLVLLPVFGPLVVGATPLTHVPPAGSEAPGFGTLHIHSGLVLDAGLFLLSFGLVARGIMSLIEAEDRASEAEDPASEAEDPAGEAAP